MNTSELADTWIRYHQKPKPPKDDPDFEAYMQLDELVHDDPVAALAVMDEIVTCTDDKHVLAAVGAGPLEDVLQHKNAPTYVQSIRDRARRDPNWRFAFGCVWAWGFASREVGEAIEADIAKYFPDGRP